MKDSAIPRAAEPFHAPDPEHEKMGRVRPRVWLRALFILGCVAVLGVGVGVGLALSEPVWLIVLISVPLEGGYIFSVLRDPLIRRQLR